MRARRKEMKSKVKKITSIMLVFVLIVLSTAVLYGCGDDDNNFETGISGVEPFLLTVEKLFLFKV